MAAALAVATLGVVFTGGDAGAVDALAVVTLLVEDTGVVLCFALTIDAQFVVLAIVAIDALGLLLIDALEIATDLATCAGVTGVTLSG